MKTKLNMKTKLIIASLFIVVLAAIYIASPYVSANNLKKTLLSGDIDKIESAVDFPSVRTNLKAQMKAELTAEMANDKEMKDNPFAGLMMAFAPNMIDNIIDGLVTPQGLIKAVEGSKESKTTDIKSAGFTGIGTFCVTTSNDIRLHFRFNGSGWTLFRLETKMRS